MTIQDHGFSRTSSPLLTEDLLPVVPQAKELKYFKKKEIDQLASQEAPLYIFQWLSINREGRPPVKIYHDDWLCGLWDEDESDGEADEAEKLYSQEHVGQRQDQLRAWLDTIE